MIHDADEDWRLLRDLRRGDVYVGARGFSCHGRSRLIIARAIFTFLAIRRIDGGQARSLYMSLTICARLVSSQQHGLSIFTICLIIVMNMCSILISLL